MSAIDLRNEMRIRTHILNLGQKAAPRVRNMLLAGAEVLWQQSQLITPQETGAMRSSGVFGLEGKGLESSAYVQYGGPGLGYTVFVHENPIPTHGEAYNIKHAADISAGLDFARRPLEQYKFLEEPARTKLDLVRAAVIRELNA